MYLLWSYLASPFLHDLGIYYYPNRWWSLAIPSYVVMGLVYIYVALASYNTGYLTLGMERVETIIDEAANVGVIERGVLRGSRGGVAVIGREKEKERDKWRRERERDKERGVKDWKDIWSQGTDAVMDVPLGGVCEVLYGDFREDED